MSDISLPILIGSKNDEVFLKEGLIYLKENSVPHHVAVASTHRDPESARSAIFMVTGGTSVKVAIAVAATATGLPGILAAYAQKERLIEPLIVIGVRASKNPAGDLNEDASFALSAMPGRVPLLYAGYNNKGFLHACMMAHKILEISQK